MTDITDAEIEAAARAMMTDQFRRMLSAAGLQYEPAQDSFMRQFVVAAITAAAAIRSEHPESVREPAGWEPTHRHVKRGTTYRKIGEAEAQVSVGKKISDGTIACFIRDGDCLTVYQAHDGKLWARFTDEFNDGRFEPLPAPPPPAQDDEAER